MTRCMVTGANGFVGSALISRLVSEGHYSVRAVVREAQATACSFPDVRGVADLGPDTEWTELLQGVDVVVHCAARVHIMGESGNQSEAMFNRVNVQGSLNLARQAAAMGVRRFIFISSIKVNGEKNHANCPFTPDDLPAPSDAYARSKLLAEEGLQRLARETGMELVIIRPPLVYGPGVGANFLTLMRWLQKGLPLPLGRIDNSRSLVAVFNLVDLIIRCIDHLGAKGEIFLVSDDDDMSTTTLLFRLSEALGKPARLIPIPAKLIMWVATILGRRSMAQRLCDSLQVDIQKTKRLLDWAPPCKVQDALNETAKHLIEQRVS